MSTKLSANSISSFVSGIFRTLALRVVSIYARFDIKPVFFLGGLATCGYGLYLRFSLGTSLIFVGGTLMLIGYLMGDKR